MKKLILTFFACMMMIGAFAQKETIQNYVDGSITKEAFVEQMNNHFDQYNLTAKQEVEIRALVEKKAENYAIIAKMKTEKPKVYQSKMRGQTQHMVEALRYILDQDQYRKFMIDARSTLIEQDPNTKKK